MYLEHLVPQTFAIAAAPRCFLHRLRQPKLVSFGLLANLVRLSRLPRFSGIDAIIDVGANIGQFAYMAHVAWPAVPIQSFEPDPVSFRGLQATCAQFAIPGMRRQVAAASAPGSAVLHVQAERVNSSLLERKDTDALEKVTVDCVTLDDVLPRGFHRALLKLDTQGTELDVLRGARETVKQCAAILVEASVIEAYEHATFLGDLMEELRGLGFVAFDILDVLRLPASEGRGIRELDLLFVPER